MDINCKLTGAVSSARFLVLCCVSCETKSQH